MHNIEIYNVNAEDDVLESGKGLHGEKKAFFDSVKDKLKKAYIDYDDKAINGNLVSLSPLWILGQDDTNRNKAYNLYWSGRSLVKKHWENLERQNGGESILCPICGLTIAKEMDHYVPREKMPEFSVHRYNLIPLCHDCNHDKSAGWLDDNGHRCFFNAFFDKGLQDKLVECIISLSPKDNQPCIEIKINNSLDMTEEINNLVVSTIKRLNLLEKFKKEAQMCLRQRLQDIRGRYEHIRNEKEAKDFWEDEKENYKYCQTNNKADFIYNSTCEAIYHSNDIEVWLETL